MTGALKGFKNRISIMSNNIAAKFWRLHSKAAKVQFSPEIFFVRATFLNYWASFHFSTSQPPQAFSKKWNWCPFDRFIGLSKEGSSWRRWTRIGGEYLWLHMLMFARKREQEEFSWSRRNWIDVIDDQVPLLHLHTLLIFWGVYEILEFKFILESREKLFSRKGAMKVLSYVMSGNDAGEACNRFFPCFS